MCRTLGEIFQIYFFQSQIFQRFQKFDWAVRILIIIKTASNYIDDINSYWKTIDISFLTNWKEYARIDKFTFDYHEWKWTKQKHQSTWAVSYAKIRARDNDRCKLHKLNIIRTTYDINMQVLKINQYSALD